MKYGKENKMILFKGKAKDLAKSDSIRKHLSKKFGKVLHKNTSIYTLQLLFEKNDNPELLNQSVNVDIKNNQNLFGANQVILEDVTDV